MTISDKLYGTEMLFERNPETNARFENVLKLRSSKIKSFQSLSTEVKNIAYINFENLASNPKEFIEHLSLKFSGLCKSAKYNPINTYKGTTQLFFKPQKYFSINFKDFCFIKNELNCSLEKEIGYSINWRR